jgi:Ca-activated chloride channel family protein
MIGDFHFIRPLALLLLVPLAVVLWLLQRRGDAAADWRKIVAPHLLPFLLSGRTDRSSKGPLWLIAIASVVAVLAIAGPTWRREPSPFADETSPVAIIIKVTPSMITEDVQPSRLECATRKIHDFLALRRGAKAALIAYAGTAHRVMPLTSDAGIIDNFASVLDPKIMPEDGDAAAEALQIADETLAGT